MAKKYKKKKSKYPGYMSFTKGLGLNPAYGQDGGELTGMMKARLAYAQMHGNPSAQRMVAPVDNPYIFTGEEPYTTPDMKGEYGTHYMFPDNNYAVPTIQQGPNGLFYNADASSVDNEAIRFDRPEDAEYFAENYKQIAPALRKNGGWLDEFEEGGFMGKTTVEAGGAKHVVYTGKKGDIMVTHPEMDNGAWDTINLTEVSDAKSLAQGVDATLDWHRKHPYHKKKAYGGYTYQDGGRTPIYVDPSDPVGMKRYQAYTDSLDVYNLSRNITRAYPNIPQITEQKYKELEEKDDNIIQWEIDKVGYKEDKKKGIKKPLENYVYSRKHSDWNHPLYVKNHPPIDKYITNNIEDFAITLPNGLIKYPSYVYKGKPSFDYYSIHDPNTGVSRHYANYDNKPGLIDIYSSNIKPIETLYYGSDKLVPANSIDLSSTGWYSGVKPSMEEQKKWQNYYLQTEKIDKYKKPVQPYKLKKGAKRLTEEPVVTKEVKKEEPIDRSILTYRITELPKEEQRGNQRYVATVVPETYQKYGTGFAERYPLTQEQYDAMGATDTIKSREGKDVPIKYLKKYGGKYRAPKYNDKRIGRGDDGGEVWLYQQDLGYLPKFLGTKTVGLQSGFSNALKNAVARNTEQQKEDTNKGYTTVLTDSNIASREGSGPYLTNEVYSEGDAAAESTSIPGLIRFAKNPIKALEGTLSSADRFIIGLSPFSKMTGTYSDFKPEELEGLSNTLDAAGVVSSVLPLAKTIPLPKGLQKVNRFLNKVEPLPKAQFPPDYNPNIPPTRSYDLNLLVEDWTDISNGLPARNYPDLPLERNEYFQDLILENQRRETQRRLNLRQQNPPGWEYLNSGTANKSKVNKSGLTKEEAIAKAAEKDKDKLSKMTETEFENTVLKPTGEIVPYESRADLMSQFTGNNNVFAMSPREYADRFNERLDLLNDIIAQRNKSGVEYKVKGIDEYGNLTFYTPPGQKIKTPPPIKNKSFSEIMNTPLSDFFSKSTVIPEGESIWSTRINPGEWKGNVEDIANTQYFRSIPGLEMSNTTQGVFADNIPRKGTGAYEAINEYLKRLDLGRVKPGFNSQTDFSRGAWENFINSGRGVGFYANPSTVYGSLKSALPYVGISGTGSWVLNNMKNRKQEYKQGGWLDEL